MQARSMERAAHTDFDDDEFDGPPELHVTDADTFERGAACSGLAIHVSSQRFQGGRVTAVFSSVTVDLRDAMIGPDGATLDVQAALSSIDILVPNDWHVVCDVHAVLGGVGGQRLRRPASETTGPRLRVTGTVVTSGLTVR